MRGVEEMLHTHTGSEGAKDGCNGIGREDGEHRRTPTRKTRDKRKREQERIKPARKPEPEPKPEPDPEPKLDPLFHIRGTFFSAALHHDVEGPTGAPVVGSDIDETGQKSQFVSAQGLFGVTYIIGSRKRRWVAGPGKRLEVVAFVGPVVVTNTAERPNFSVGASLLDVAAQRIRAGLGRELKAEGVERWFLNPLTRSPLHAFRTALIEKCPTTFMTDPSVLHRFRAQVTKFAQFGLYLAVPAGAQVDAAAIFGAAISVLGVAIVTGFRELGIAVRAFYNAVAAHRLEKTVLVTLLARWGIGAVAFFLGSGLEVVPAKRNAAVVGAAVPVVVVAVVAVLTGRDELHNAVATAGLLVAEGIASVPAQGVAVIAGLFALNNPIPTHRVHAVVGALVAVAVVAVVALLGPLDDTVSAGGKLYFALGATSIAVDQVAVVALLGGSSNKSVAAALELAVGGATVVFLVVAVVAVLARIHLAVAAQGPRRRTTIVSAGILVHGIAVVTLLFAIQLPISAEALGGAPTAEVAGVVADIVAVIAFLSRLQQAVPAVLKATLKAAVLSRLIAVFALLVAGMNHPVPAARGQTAGVDAHRGITTKGPVGAALTKRTWGETLVGNLLGRALDAAAGRS